MYSHSFVAFLNHSKCLFKTGVQRSDGFLGENSKRMTDGSMLIFLCRFLFSLKYLLPIFIFVMSFIFVTQKKISELLSEKYHLLSEIKVLHPQVIFFSYIFLNFFFSTFLFFDISLLYIYIWLRLSEANKVLIISHI